MGIETESQINERSIEPATQLAPETDTDNNTMKKAVIIGIVGLLVLIVLIVIAVYFLLQPTTDTAKIRDVFIIFMAFESLLLGFALIILMIQLARLTNLLQNEIKPILETTNETVSTLRGTTAFLSNNLVEPVIKLNEYVAALSQALAIIGLARKKK